MASRRATIFAFLSALVLAAVLPAIGQPLTPPPGSPGFDLFTNGSFHRLSIEISPAEVASLRKDPRTFVRAVVREGTDVYQDVAVHLKGSIGTFRPVDERPDLTLDFSRFKAHQKYHGLRRVHLNNALEDPSYVNELIGGEMFRAAGVPAPRVTRAQIALNLRPLGLYVLIEGFTEDFLACYYKTIGGNLYEPDAGHDVDQQLKRNSVNAPKTNKDDLKALAAAAFEPNPVRRDARLQQVLDMDRFVTFMAMEVLLGHRDGYCLARNNFRIYHDVDSGKMVFLPHGMDQLLGRADFPWEPSMAGVVAKAVMDIPEGRRRYETRFADLFTNLFDVQKLTNRVDQLTRDLQPWLSQGDYENLQRETAVVKDRIIQRQISLKTQLSQPPLAFLKFENGIAVLDHWEAGDTAPAGVLDRVTSNDGAACLHTALRSDGSVSWRSKALLNPGHYRFGGKVKITAVKPLPSGAHQGAGLRVTGGVRQSPDFTGTASWREMSYEFQVDSAGEVEFLCELRASSGEAWFDTSSLRVFQMP